MGMRILRGKGAVIDREFADTPFPFRMNPTVHVQLVVLCPRPRYAERQKRTISFAF